MGVELRFAPEAHHDVDEAYAWYETQQIGLGEIFLSRLDACIRAIVRAPELHHVVHESYRRALLRRFPYAVFYEFSENSVTVYCVFHTSRDPQKWRSRLS